MRRALILVALLAGIIRADEIVPLKIIGTGTIGPYGLGYKHILVSSEKIVFQGKVLSSPLDYRFEYDEGYIIFSQAIPLAETVKISFSVLPLELKQSYALRQPLPVALSDTAISAIAPKRTQSLEGLEIIGSKRFVVNIGNRGEPGLSQSLDLDVAGRLADGVTVKGSISDRNFGSGSGGGTSSLDELDKIFLRLEAPHFKVDFGDLELSGIKNSLLDYKRKLTGINVSGDYKSVDGSTAFAFSPGKQAELSFLGIDGKQGPYFLQSAQSIVASNLSIAQFLPGTEEIYLDGRKLTRGNENDYSIDYYDGYIEFTPRNVISAKSRITARIQYTAEAYRRTFYYGQIAGENRLKLGMQYLGEADDNSSPRSFEMGEAQRQAISDAGENPDSAYLSGAKFVGAGKGDYNIQIDSLADTLYTYVGNGAGNYDVGFSRVGSGRGAYQYTGAGKYVFVGKGNGAYSPVIFYPLPQSQNYGSMMLKKDGAFHFDSELAFSRNDRNIISSKDQTLVGSGFRGSGGFSVDSLDFADKLWRADFAELRWRNLGRKFYYPGSINPTEFYRQYNLVQNSSIVNQRLFEVESKAATDQGDYLNFGYGLLKGDGVDAKRGFGGFNIITFERLALSSSVELSQARNPQNGQLASWNKYAAGGKIISGMLLPSVAIRHELKASFVASSDNYRADEFEAGLAVSPSRIVSTTTKLIYRKQQYPFQNSGWRNQYHQYQLEQGLAVGDAKSGLSSEANFARLYQKSCYPLNEKFSRNIGTAKLNYGAADYGFTLYESVNGTSRVLQAREYIYVGPGKGDYRRDGEDYIPETGGDYIQVIRQPGEYEITGPTGYQITGGMRIRFDGRGLAKAIILKKVSYEGDVSFQTNLNPGVGIAAKYLTPVGNFPGNEISFKSYDFRQSTTYRIGAFGDYIRHTLAASQSQGSQYQFENLGNKTVSNALETKLFSGHKIGSLSNIEYAKDDRTIYSGNVNITRGRIGLTPSYQYSIALRFELPAEYSKEHEKIRGLDVTVYSGGVKTVANFGKTGRIEGRLDYSAVNVNHKDIFIPYVMASGKKPGDNYSGLLSCHLKLNNYSGFELSYNYKKLGDGYSNYNLRMEAKAEF